MTPVDLTTIIRATRRRVAHSRPTAGELWTALLAGTIGVAGSFAFAGPTTDFLAVPVTDAIITLTPGPVTAAMIQVLGQGSELLALTTAVGVAVLAVAFGTLVGIRLGRRVDPRAGPLLGTYFAAWAIAAGILRDPFAALGPAVPAVVVVWARHRSETPAARPDRRAVLKTAAGVIGFTGLAGIVGLQRANVETSPLRALPPAEREIIDERLAAARRNSFDVAGIDGLVTRTDAFYEVDINPVNPDVTAADWSLSVTGAVDRQLELDYGELTNHPIEHRFATLRCVGEPLNGQELDNALWTGIPVAGLLAEASPHSDCECVMLRAADGYYEEFPLAALKPGLLAFGMNGGLLPRAHGFPVRALVPGHWGEVNVKWLTEIELLERETDGFWEIRGWHGTGPVETVAKLHAVNRLDDGRMQIGGHAYAGTRGIDSVEVSLDGGDTWAASRLTTPLPDPDSWRQWAFEWVPSHPRYEVVVRAVDGDGRLQPREESAAFPSGATGWVSRTVEP